MAFLQRIPGGLSPSQQCKTPCCPGGLNPTPGRRAQSGARVLRFTSSWTCCPHGRLQPRELSALLLSFLLPFALPDGHPRDLLLCLSWRHLVKVWASSLTTHLDPGDSSFPAGGTCRVCSIWDVLSRKSEVLWGSQRKGARTATHGHPSEPKD